MRWEQRLRDLLLAGGTLAAGACIDRGTDATVVHASPIPCCNASPDPCCTCAGPDAAIDPAACTVKTACESDGGTLVAGASGSRCEFPQEAAPADDASDDGASDVVLMSCCNANYDPCCSCDGPDAALETTVDPFDCATERGCVAEGGTYEPGFALRPDGASSGPYCAWEPRPADGGVDGDGNE